VLQCVAVCCSVLQSVCCSVYHEARTRLSEGIVHLPFVAECCSVLQCVAVCCGVLQCFAVCCSVLQFVCCSAEARTHLID